MADRQIAGDDQVACFVRLCLGYLLLFRIHSAQKTLFAASMLH